MMLDIEQNEDECRTKQRNKMNYDYDKLHRRQCYKADAPPSSLLDPKGSNYVKERK